MSNPYREYRGMVYTAGTMAVGADRYGDSTVYRGEQRRERNLNRFDPAGWTRHTEYHYSRLLNGKRLDYWPSRNRFQYDGRVMVGDVIGFIRNREQEQPK